MSDAKTTLDAILNDISDERELCFCILLSLLLQILLNVGGNFRRLASSKWIVSFLWLAYLLSDIVSVFTLGLTVSKQRLYVKYCNANGPYYKWQSVSGRTVTRGREHIDLPVFWAPFLLVHLAGPDTITAFAPEDNELWPRHLIYLASQCIAVTYIFFESLQFDNKVAAPTLLILLCGIIKCVERTAALYYGSAKSFRNSMLSKSDLVASITKKEPKLLIIENGNALSHLQALQYAFVYFTVFKKLAVDLILSVHERNQSRLFFLETSCEDAFRLVEIELNYLYDVLFTKLPVLHHKLGYCGRSLSFIAVVVALKLHVSQPGNLHAPEEQITLVLLIGAVVLEVIAFYQLLFCDWTILNLRPLSDANPNGNFCKDKFLDCMLYVIKTRSRFVHWFLRFVGLKHLRYGSEFTDASFLNGVWYVKPQPVSRNMTGFIFGELKMKSEMADSLAIAKVIFSSKGEWVLENEGQGTFLPFIANYNYDDIVLLWHIATEICYNDSQDQLTDKEQCDTAKKLSDYMLYLMVMKPDMMSAVSGIGEIKFRDTCTEVGELFDTKLPELKKKNSCNFFRREGKEDKEALQRKACETILSLNGEIEQVAIPRGRSILFTASRLAKELNSLPSDKKWLIISKLWVELLSYAASHIRSSAHAEQLSRGGELITIVWLLMAHFGLGDQYENNPVKQA
ncbi:hypothetical protein POM88_019897 [Heracleum sosnowskyi]|uniref:DUF4220 domain-containing protein n=1 Tax=Heracleum sosnowskyi TaxID=360622 RepID=A0AAD8IAD5_9APIA|nr:hypothetical protein POM88_019897 [Heracleum sosnowskyi]